MAHIPEIHTHENNRVEASMNLIDPYSQKWNKYSPLTSNKSDYMDLIYLSFVLQLKTTSKKLVI